MSRLRRATTRVGGFGSSVVLSGLAGLLVIPVIIGYAGEAGWASIAVGQSTGVVLAILSGLGWAQTGPTEIARAGRRARGVQFRDSLTLRIASLVVTLPAAFGAAIVLRPQDSPVATLAAVSAILTACGAGWFFIGCGDPIRLMLFDTLPRVAGITLGAVATAVTGAAIAAAIGMVVGSVAGVLLSAIWIMRHYGKGERRTLRELVAILSGQLDGIGIAACSAAYLSVPLLFVAAAHPAAIASYAIADKLKQQAMTAITPIAQTLQGWVPKASGPTLKHRVRLTAKTAFVAAFAGGSGFVLAAPHVGSFLGAGSVQVGLDLGVPLGMAFSLNVLTLIVGTSCLLPLGRSRTVFLSAASGAAVILPALGLLSALGGPTGVAWAVVVAQAAVAGVQLVGLARASRSEGTPTGDRAGDSRLTRNE